MTTRQSKCDGGSNISSSLKDLTIKSTQELKVRTNDAAATAQICANLYHNLTSRWNKGKKAKRVSEELFIIIQSTVK